MTGLASMLNLADFRAASRRRLPRGLFDYIDRGNEDDHAVRRNREAFTRLKFRPRVLAHASARRQEIEIFGRRYAMPVGIAPTGPASFLRHDGDSKLARAASRLDVPFVLSSAAGTCLTKVRENGGPGAKWFQLYVSGDRRRSIDLIQRVADAGYEALVFTVDAIVTPNREFAERAGYTLPPRLNRKVARDALLRPRWLLGTMGRYALSGGLPAMPNYPLPARGEPGHGQVAVKDDGIGWDTLREIRDSWRGPLVVKGVLDARDAATCVELGANGIIVSNHGGLALDEAISPLEALPAVAAAVGKRAEIFIDGGITRGSDVLKALALGARAVFVGRATLHALAAFGEAGVVRALELLRDEIDRNMASLGCRDVSDFSRDWLVAEPGFAPSGGLPG